MTNQFHLRPSRYLTLLLTLLYIGAGFIIAYTLPLSHDLKLCLLCMHSLHFYAIWHHVIRLKSPHSIIYLQHTDMGEWYIGQRDGIAHQAILQPGSICTFYFVSLRFKLIPTGHYKTVFIVTDNLTTKEARQLRRLLWWEL